MDKDKLERLRKMIEITNDGVNREEFLDLFKKITEQIANLEAKLIKTIDYKEQEEKKKLEILGNEFKQIISEPKKEIENKFSSLSSEIKSSLEVELKKIKEKIKEFDNKVFSVRDGMPGKDGKDADEGKIIGEVLKRIVLPKIDKTEIEKLKEEIEEFRRNKRFGGGGFSKIHMEGKFIDDETPTGTINGVNTIFTLANIPNPPLSLKVFVNGSRMRITEDYTLAVKTITFITAPPTGSIILCDYRQ